MGSYHDAALTVTTYYPSLMNSVDACLSVLGAMSLKGRTRPLSLMFETPSGYGKTTVLEMTFPASVPDLQNYVYRSDKFTPKSFVSHAANIESKKLKEVDLLPKVRNKVLVTKELAPIFRGRPEDLTETFSMLISVLDGKGFTSDSGTRGKRGYEGEYIFNWIGATTPLSAATHRLMSQLGTRLLFYEVPVIQPTTQDLVAYATAGNPGHAEGECNRAINNLLWDYYERHPIASVEPASLTFPPQLLDLLVRWAVFLVQGRAEIRCERVDGDWEPVAALQPEGPWKVVNYFKELAWGHALIHGRTVVTEDDIEVVADVAMSSIPGHLRPILRELRKSPSVDSSKCRSLCAVSQPTARKYLKELDLLGIVTLTKGSPGTNQPDTATLASAFQWLR